MIVVSRSTVRNPKVLKMRQLPRRFFGRVAVWPRRQVGLAEMLRLIVEFQAVRYALTLLPLILIGMTWNATALPLAQAPILMVALIWVVEMRVLRVPATRRNALIEGAAADRALDLLRVQGRDVLTRIAAMRDIRQGNLHLVVEQSALWRVAPLTYVSVQSDLGPEILDLLPQEITILEERLFQGPLTERLLQRVNQSQNTYLRDVTFDARGVSAHARLAAALA